ATSRDRPVLRCVPTRRSSDLDQLQVTLRIAPEVLPVAVPFLCLQPLVENAVRHGLESKPGSGHITILAEDAGAECLISVEDDGRSEEHTSELQSRENLVCRLL